MVYGVNGESPGFWPGLFISSSIVADRGELPRNADVIDGYGVRWFWGLTRGFIEEFWDLFYK
jgi:hypothetical protein